MRKSIVVGVILGLLFLLGAGGSAQAIDSPYDGWWYVSGQSGTGVSVEIQGNALFMALYVFREDGTPAWYISGGPLASSSSYSGNLQDVKGFPLGQSSTAPQYANVGTVQLTFASATQATLNWTANGTSGTMTLTKFMDQFGTTQDMRDINGWWFDPNYNGMGFFVEVQGNVLFMAWYHYRADGSSRWWSAGQTFNNGSATYSDNGDDARKLWTWINGQSLGGAYKTGDHNVASPITLAFNGYSNATLTSNVGTYNLTRFRFGAFGGEVPVQYTGNSGQAAITPANAVAITMAGLKGVSSFSYLGDLLKTSASVTPSLKDVPQSLEEAHARALNSIHNLQAANTDTFYGNCGGSLSYSLDFNQNTGNIGGSFSADKYCNNGLHVDGSGTLSGSLAASGSTLNVSLTATVNPTTITTDSEDITLKGTLTAHANGTSSNLNAGATGDFLNRDNLLGEVYWANNFVLTLTDLPSSLPGVGSGLPTGSVGFTMTGRYYHPAYGYVDMTSDGPFTVANSSSSGTSGITFSGSLIANGANGTKCKLTPNGTSSFTVQVDTNGDGSYDWNSGTLNTADFFPVGGGSSGGGTTQQAYWGANAFLCCPSGTYSFKASLEGQSSTITRQNCDDMPALPSYIATAAGSKTFSWQDVSTNCAAYSGTVNATLTAGKCYRVYRYIENNELKVEVYEDLENCPY